MVAFEFDFSDKLAAIKGDDFSFCFVALDPDSGLPLNLTGYTAELVIREDRTDYSEQLFEMTTANSMIVFTNALRGEVQLTVANKWTEHWNWKRGYYAFKLCKSGTKKTHRFGKFDIVDVP